MGGDQAQLGDPESIEQVIIVCGEIRRGYPEVFGEVDRTVVDGPDGERLEIMSGFRGEGLACSRRGRRPRGC